MKSLLWAVLTLGLVVNASTSFVFDGIQQLLISIATGVVVLASAAGLYVLRDKHSG
ncbi:hypothetical protein ABT174_05340 [Streptomyces sparsogenes]|uniref:hypothetical protein n=1 Tax=Streptomyces sparsogenes TaxID=67365 RepID=UPI00332D868A